MDFSEAAQQVAQEAIASCYILAMRANPQVPESDIRNILDYDLELYDELTNVIADGLEIFARNDLEANVLWSTDDFSGLTNLLTKEMLTRYQEDLTTIKYVVDLNLTENKLNET